jgi:hypothetical protein
MTLLESIRKGKIKQPTQNRFDIKKWVEEYKKTLDEDNFEDKDISLFIAGVVIFELLSNVRTELSNLYKKKIHLVTMKKY